MKWWVVVFWAVVSMTIQFNRVDCRQSGYGVRVHFFSSWEKSVQLFGSWGKVELNFFQLGKKWDQLFRTREKLSSTFSNFQKIELNFCQLPKKWVQLFPSGKKMSSTSLPLAALHSLDICLVTTNTSYPSILCPPMLPRILLKHQLQYTRLWGNIWTFFFFIFSSFHKSLKSPPIPSPLLKLVHPLISKSKWNNKKHHKTFRQYHITHRRAHQNNLLQNQFLQFTTPPHVSYYW